MSFWIYPITFGLSCCFMKLTEKVKKEQRIIIVFVALLIPSVVSGCRDHSMGYDVNHYGELYFSLAKQLPFREYMALMFAKQIEPLYALLNTIVAFFTNSSAILYGVQTFIILLLVYATIVDNNYSPTICMLAFYCILYIDTFNVLRQHLSVAIVFFSFRYIKRQSFWRFAITILISMGFHVTGIIGLIFWPLYWWIKCGLIKNDNSIYKNNKPWARDAVIIIFALLLLVLFDQISEFAVGLGILPTRYAVYLSEKSLTIGLVSILSRVPLVILAIYLYKDNSNKDSNYDFLLVCLILEIILVQLKSINLVFLRMSYIFLEFKILMVGLIHMNFRPLEKKVFVVRVIIVAYLISYFVLQFFVLSNEGVYKSTILGI